MDDQLSREEMHATLGVRREMGHEIEPALVDSLAEKIEATVQRRYQAELASRSYQDQAARVGRGGRVAVGIVSLVMSIPLTAIVLSNGGGLAGLALVWVSIVLVNMVVGMRRPGR